MLLGRPATSGLRRAPRQTRVREQVRVAAMVEVAAARPSWLSDVDKAYIETRLELQPGTVVRLTETNCRELEQSEVAELTAELSGGPQLLLLIKVR